MLTSGQTLSHYRILERIGGGGMGEVYKAVDTRLERTVAIKVLPPEAVRDSDRRRRFMQEARAASALDHPNIVVVHDIGEAEGIHFIAMQYVSGETLRERVGRMKLTEALGFAIQMADALAAAHAHGIVHRDLKPENVVVTEQGVAKILDFGVAKLTELGDSEDAPTRDQDAPVTREGHVVGTAAYMSPEQAEGRKVDARSDVFSFGSVLYEMVTGKRAFEGTSLPSILTSVLRDEPAPVSERLPQAPLELERILARALRKDPGRRFQSMADLKIALEDLRNELDSGVAITAKGRAVRRSVPIWGWTAGAAVMALATLAFLRYRSPGTDSLSPPRVVPLTSDLGYEGNPALSPDGRQVAFVTERDLYVKLIDGGQELRLTDNTEEEFLPAWSADGGRIAFVRHVEEDGQTRDGIFVISALGGPEKRLGTSLGGDFHGLSWSADGRELAVVSGESVEDVHAIYLLSVDSGEMRKLTDPPRECSEALSVCGDTSPIFSPDGRVIAFIRIDSQPSIFTVAPDSGELKRITEGYVDLWPDGSLAWAADGKGIIFSVYGSGLFRIPISGGEPERLAFVEEGAGAPSTSRQGNRLAYEKPLSDMNIWKIPGPRSKNKGAPQRFIASTRDDRGPRYSPDGKQIVFVSDRSGVAEVWVSDANGENARKPFAVSEVGAVDWSPDGRQILFDQYVESRDLFVGSIDGGQLRPLTDWPGGEWFGKWSGDGRWIYFTRSESAVGNANGIWRIPAAGGEPIPVTRGGGRLGRESPDPKYVLFTPDEVNGIWRVPVEGGAEEKLIETIGSVFKWDVFEKGICYLDRSGDVATLRFHDLESGKVTDLATLDRFFNSGNALSVSPDGEWVLLSRQDAAGTDLMLVENFR